MNTVSAAARNDDVLHYGTPAPSYAKHLQPRLAHLTYGKPVPGELASAVKAVRPSKIDPAWHDKPGLQQNPPDTDTK